MKFNPILRHNYRIEHFAHTNQVVSSKKSPAFSLILCFAHSSTLSFLLKRTNSLANEKPNEIQHSMREKRENFLWKRVGKIFLFLALTRLSHVFSIESVCPSFKLSAARLETAISCTNVSTYQTLEHCLKWIPILAVLNRKLLFWYWGRIYPDHPQLCDAISSICNIQWFSSC